MLEGIKKFEAQFIIEDNNIFAPSGLTDIIGGTHFAIYKSTIWDVLQELTYRHPGAIAASIPYEGTWGPRMSLFFGLPTGFYVSRDYSSLEKDVAQKLRLLGSRLSTQKGANKLKEELDILLNDKGATTKALIDSYKKITGNNDFQAPKGIATHLPSSQSRREAVMLSALHPGASIARLISGYWDAPDKPAEDAWAGTKTLASGHKILTTLARDITVSKLTTKFLSKREVLKPFRGFHLLTSQNNIVSNDVVSSAYSTFNSATVEYSEQDATAIAEKESDGELSSSDTVETLTLKADASIPDEEIREIYGFFPNCIGFEQAKRFAQSLLWRSMKKGYRGSITIIGKANIKPHDICFIFDEYTDIKIN